jgi:hypothetical protein
VPFGQPVRLGQWGHVPVVSHSPLVGCVWPRHRSPRTSDATSATAPSPPDSGDSARGRVLYSDEWVGAERGVQRPVSPHRPLPPYVRLSHLYGDRLKVSFNPSASHWHPQEHSPALASSEMKLQGTLQAPALPPCTRLSRAPWPGRDPWRVLRPNASSRSRGFGPTWRFVPRLNQGASHFRHCSR